MQLHPVGHALEEGVLRAEEHPRQPDHVTEEVHTDAQGPGEPEVLRGDRLPDRLPIFRKHGLVFRARGLIVSRTDCLRRQAEAVHDS